jgi:hypothetical protein
MRRGPRPESHKSRATSPWCRNTADLMGTTSVREFGPSCAHSVSSKEWLFTFQQAPRPFSSGRHPRSIERRMILQNGEWRRLFMRSRTRGMNSVEGNTPTMRELEQIEESAHRSDTPEAKIVLRLSAALREVLQAKENAVALASEFKRRAGANH